MKILFVTHYYPPEVGAPQARISETAELLTARGHSVTVLTGFPNYPDGVIHAQYRGRFFQRERINGVNVIRTAVYPAANKGFVLRLINHTSFALSSLLGAMRVPKQDVVIAESPPLFTAAASVVIARRVRSRLILNVSDLWPESAEQLGALASSLAIRSANALADFCYAHAELVLVPVPGMKDLLQRRGVPPAKVAVVPNAVDVARFHPMPLPRNSPPHVVYCGTVGLAQGIRTILDAARELQQAGDAFDISIVGDGAERRDLELLAREWELGNVRFAGRVLRDEVPEVLARADIALLTLRALPIFDAARPSKLLEYMAAARPVVAAARGDVVALIDAAACGISCQPEDAHGVADALRRLASDLDEAERMGRNGRGFVEAKFTRIRVVSELERLLAPLSNDDETGIRRTYDAYERGARRRKAWGSDNRGSTRIAREAYGSIAAALAAADAWPIPDRPLLDAGCGHGELLRWLVEHGAEPRGLFGVDLIEERIAAARAVVPEATLAVGDLRRLPYESHTFRAVVLSLVLSSLVERRHRFEVAREATRVLRPGGIILCYDARYPNPWNRRVVAVTPRELRRLFPGASIRSTSLTLIPPLARRLGPATDVVYPALLAFPALRSHLLSAITHGE